jgi:hypothetical protein
VQKIRTLIFFAEGNTCKKIKFRICNWIFFIQKVWTTIQFFGSSNCSVLWILSIVFNTFKLILEFCFASNLVISHSNKILNFLLHQHFFLSWGTSSRIPPDAKFYISLSYRGWFHTSQQLVKQLGSGKDFYFIYRITPALQHPPNVEPKK